MQVYTYVFIYVDMNTFLHLRTTKNVGMPNELLKIASK